MTPYDLWEKNRRLAYKVAGKSKILYPFFPEEDLYQEALLGLWIAANGYDGSFKFLTYAFRVILRRLRNKALMMYPKGWRKHRSGGKRPVVMNMAENRVGGSRLYNVTKYDLMYQPVSPSRCHEDVVDDRDYVGTAIGRAVSKTRRRLVARLLWQEGMSVKEVAEVLGVVHSAVRHQSAKAIEEITAWGNR